MLRKDKLYCNSSNSFVLKDRTISNDTKDKVSNMSEYSSVEELHVWYYLFTTSSKGKYVRSQEDSLFVINLQLLIMVAVTEIIVILLVPWVMVKPVWSIRSKL